MPKKFFDILPPAEKKGEKPLPTPPLEEREEESLPSAEKVIPRPPLSKKKKGWMIVGIFILFLIITGIFCQNFLARAEISIWPETTSLNFGGEVTVDSKVNELNVAGKIIPGKIFEDQKSLSQQFSASGKISKEEKAKGVIRVYNNYSVSPQILATTTRFISDTGKLFRSIRRVTVPGGIYEKDKLVPGYVDVEVEAAEAGSEYNIGSSTFSIPGFAGTPKYTAFYGKSFSPMEGGFLGEVPQVTKEDLEKAKNIITERLKKESRDSLKVTISEDFVLLDEGISQEIVKASSLIKAGAEIEKFDFQVEIKTLAIGFKKSDLENFAKELINLNTSEDKKFQKESLKINYSAKSINLKEGKITLNLDFSGKIFSDVDDISLKKALLGKSLKETQMLLKESPQIIKAQVKIFPFWLGKVPLGEEKVKIKLIID